MLRFAAAIISGFLSSVFGEEGDDLFNKYVWDIYRNSSEGKAVIRMFAKNLGRKYGESYPDKIYKLHSKFFRDEDILAAEREDLITLSEMLSENPLQKIPVENLSDKKIIETAESYFNFFCESFSEGSGNAKAVFSEFSEMLTINSTYFTAAMPDFFVPYYYADDFKMLKKICRQFDADIPSAPKKSEYKKRMFFYLDICKALYKFRTENGMTPYELFAFLYDFAPQFVINN